MVEENESNVKDELYEHFRFVVDPGTDMLRIDKYLFNLIRHTSRNKIQQAAKAGCILVNGKAEKQNYKVHPNDVISVLMPNPPRDTEILPEDIPLNIQYEDDDLLIINKEAGMVVHPAFGNSSEGSSNFAVLNLAVRAEAQLRGWIIRAQAGFTPVALLYRPGFSYISNYDRDAANPVDCAFDQYQLYWAAAAGLATEVGCSRQLPNGNEIGLTYRWQHLTSRTSPDRLAAPHRFDCASHALMIHLMFNIK